MKITIDINLKFKPCLVNHRRVSKSRNHPEGRLEGIEECRENIEPKECDFIATDGYNWATCPYGKCKLIGV